MSLSSRIDGIAALSGVISIDITFRPDRMLQLRVRVDKNDTVGID